MISGDYAPGDEATSLVRRLIFFDIEAFVVSVAQLAELWIVAPVAGGSNPLAHPTLAHP